MLSGWAEDSFLFVKSEFNMLVVKLKTELKFTMHGDRQSNLASMYNAIVKMSGCYLLSKAQAPEPRSILLFIGLEALFLT